MRLQVRDCRDEVLAHCALVALSHQGKPFYIIARVTTQRRQGVRRKTDEAGDGQSPRDIFNVRIEATILVYHYNGR